MVYVEWLMQMSDLEWAERCTEGKKELSFSSPTMDKNPLSKG